MWTIKNKSLLNLSQCCFCFFLFCFGLAFWPWGMWDLSPLIRDQTSNCRFGRWSQPLDHQGSPSSFQSSLKRCLFGVSLPYQSIYNFKSPVGHSPLPVSPSALYFVLMSLWSILFWLTAWLISHLPSSPIKCNLQEYRAFVSFIYHCEITPVPKNKLLSTK